MYKIDRSLIIDVSPIPKEPPVIIKKESLEPPIDLKKIRKKAEEQAADIIAAAEQNAEEIKKNAYEKGYQEGHDVGYSEGEQKARVEFQAMKEEGQSIIAKSYAEREKMILEAEEAVAKLAIDIAKKIVLKEIDYDDAFINIVRKALGKLATANKATLFVNPDEYERYFPDGNGEMVTDNGVITFTIEANSSLPKGSCTIETEDGTIKAGVNEQIEKIREACFTVAVGEG